LLYVILLLPLAHCFWLIFAVIFILLLATSETLAGAHRTLGFHGTPVEKPLLYVFLQFLLMGRTTCLNVPIEIHPHVSVYLRVDSHPDVD